MKHEIKIFAVVGTIATICVTAVSLYAISKNAEWTSIGIIVGIIGATITVIIPVTQHILFRFKGSSDGSKEIDFNISQENSPLSISVQNIDIEKKEELTNNKDKDAEKLLVHLIIEQQKLFVKQSYGESANECFTWDDLEHFKHENTIAEIQRNLEESHKFRNLVRMLIELPDRKRRNIFQKGKCVFKKTWEELGEITITGQTDAGQKAEKMIADTIVELAQEQVTLNS